jgi:hypothetical protein
MTAQAPKQAVYVHQLRASPQVEDELEWFFNRAESDMGVPSNFQLAPWRDGAMGQRTPEHTFHAARRHRRVRTWLKAIPDSDAGVLQCAYLHRPWPVALHGELGRLTGVVVRLACSLGRWPDDRAEQEATEMARAEWLVSTGSRLHADVAILRLRQEAEVRFVGALRAYTGARSRIQVGRWS